MSLQAAANPFSDSDDFRIGLYIRTLEGNESVANKLFASVHLSLF